MRESKVVANTCGKKVSNPNLLVVQCYLCGNTVTHSFCMQDYSTVGIPDYIAPEVMLKEGLWDGM
jgi:hypothetical protein